MDVGGLVNVRMDVRNTPVLVHMPMYLPAAHDLSQCVDAQTDQHQRHTEFQYLGQTFADLEVQEDNEYTRDKDRDRMTDAHSAPISEALQTFLRSLTMVETAARWSGSAACFRPSPKLTSSSQNTDNSVIKKSQQILVLAFFAHDVSPILALHKN